jgi:hypothetical protein
MTKINPRQTKALDNHPALKGGQSRLPDALQAKIIGSKLRKTAAKKDKEDSKQLKITKKMNRHPVLGTALRAGIGGGLGYGVGKITGSRSPRNGAFIGASLLPVLGEAERRMRNKYYGPEKVSSFTKVASELEGRMAKRQLTEICEMAQELLMYMSDEEDLHEWVQNKITTIHDRLSSVHSYVSYEKKNPPMMMQPQMLGAGV